MTLDSAKRRGTPLMHSTLTKDLNCLIATTPYPEHATLAWSSWKKPGGLSAEAGCMAYELGKFIINARHDLQYTVEERSIKGSWGLRSYHLCIGPRP